ncbi:MAG: extracellular solute-binding protein [Ruminococcaceae bacterium]|nr:extracellular solute-binding protein [Oscillospiraceae bacterium]
MKKVKQVIAFALLGAMLFMCGCNDQTVAIDGTKYEFKRTMDEGYPVEDTETIVSWWAPLYVHVTTKYGNLGDTPFGKMVIDETGVNVKWIHPPQGQESTQFNIILSSGEMPDVISYNWSTYANGGAAGAIKDKLIIPVNTIIEKGGAPGLKKLMETDKRLQSFITDEGWIPGFPSVGAQSQVVYNGPMVRKDLLDKAGLAVPETIAEMETALYAFKEQGIKIPLEVELGKHMVAGNAIVGGFGVGASYYVDNGKVKYGPAEPQFKDFLATMNRWYNDGLYDNEFSTLQGSNRFTAELLGGNIGMAFGANGGQWGKWLPALAETRPDIDFVSMPFPTTEKGTKPEFGHMESMVGGSMTAISTHCQNIELAAKLLDYGYTEKGNLQYTFGVENRDWAYGIDGNIMLTDRMTKQDLNGGQSLSEVLGQHSASGFQGSPRVQREDILDVFFSLDKQKENVRTWSKTNMTEHIMPNLQYTTEESQELASLKTAIETHMHEMMYKFIAGTESLDKWDAYLANYETIGLSRALEIMQAAYDRYEARAK